jgi:hypothetical protein
MSDATALFAVYHPPPGIGLVFVTLAYQIYAKYKASKQAQL